MIRGIVKAITEGFIKLFSATGRTGETIDNREYFQHYGLTSRPLAGAELIIINEGNHYIAIASDDRRYRLAIENGEVALYTDEGDKIHLKRDKTIEIVSGNKLTMTVTNEVDVTTKTVKVTASTVCDVAAPSILLGSQGTTRFLCDERQIAAFNSHTHGGGPVPDQQQTIANVCTSITKAG
jgi:phage gp45-like